MSTELKGTKSLTGNVNLTRYYGGLENGECVQVGPDYGKPAYLQLTKSQALELAEALIQFAADMREDAE